MSFARPPISLLFVCTAMAVLAAAEGLLRLDAVRDRVPPPIPYYSDNVARRVRALEITQHEEGPVDIVFVGSSVVRSNIRPLVVDAAMAAAGMPATSFNAGLSGLAPDEVSLYLERMWLPRARPRWVVQGIRLAELVSDRRATDFHDNARARVEHAWLDDGWWGPARRWSIENLRLVHYRGALSDALDRPQWPPSRRWGYAIDRRGHAEALRPPGELVVKAYTPSDWNASNVTDNLASLSRSLEASRAHGARFLLVDMAEHPARYDARPSLRARYDDAMRSWARRQGVPFIDLTSGDADAFRNDAWFRDDHHMSPEGAQRFSRALGVALAATREGERHAMD